MKCKGCQKRFAANARKVNGSTVLIQRFCKECRCSAS